MSFLDAMQPDEIADLPTADLGVESDLVDVTVGNFNQAAIQKDYWHKSTARKTKHRGEMLDAISEAVHGDPAAWRPEQTAEFLENPTGVLTINDFKKQADANITSQDQMIERLFLDLESKRTIEPGRFANFPTSYDALLTDATDKTREELNAELEDANNLISNRSDPGLGDVAAGFAGQGAAVVTDFENVVTLPFGLGRAGLATTMLKESLIGGSAEIAALPRTADQADFLDIDDPNFALQVGAGFAFGAAVPLGLRGGAKAFGASVRGVAVSRDAILSAARKATSKMTAGQRGAVTALERETATEGTARGSDVESHAADIDDAEKTLLSDDPISPNATNIPDIPIVEATTGKIRNKPITDDVRQRLTIAAASTDPSLSVVVVSGGQDTIGLPNARRTGSTRHDHGGAADIVLMRNGKRVTPAQDPELYARFLENAARAGFTGIGHYKWGVHVGGGTVAAWGPNKTAASLDPTFAAAIQRGRGNPVDTTNLSFDGDVTGFARDMTAGRSTFRLGDDAASAGTDQFYRLADDFPDFGPRVARVFSEPVDDIGTRTAVVDGPVVKTFEEFKAERVAPPKHNADPASKPQKPPVKTAGDLGLRVDTDGLRKEFDARVKSGEFITPKQLDRLTKKAGGKPGNASTKSAIRALKDAGFEVGADGKAAKNRRAAPDVNDFPELNFRKTGGQFGQQRTFPGFVISRTDGGKFKAVREGETKTTAQSASLEGLQKTMRNFENPFTGERFDLPARAADNADPATGAVPDLDAVGDALNDKSFFGDPLDDLTARAQVEGIEADINLRLKQDTQADFDLPATDTAPVQKVSEAMREIADGEEFLDQLKLCMPKGV